MPAMVAPRALVFRPLVKGNEGFENEIAQKPDGQNSVISFVISTEMVAPRVSRSPTADQGERRV